MRTMTEGLTQYNVPFSPKPNANSQDPTAHTFPRGEGGTPPGVTEEERRAP